MNSEFLCKTGRFTFVIVNSLSKALKNLVTIPMMFLKPVVLLTPVFAFWLSIALISFCNVTLAQIVNNPAGVVNISLALAIIVGVYNLTSAAIQNS